MGQVEQSSFLAQSTNRPVRSPKTRPTWATSLPDTCSIKCLNGRHASRTWQPCPSSRPTSCAACLSHLDRWGDVWALVPQFPLLPGALHRPQKRSRRRPPWSTCQARHCPIPATPRFLDTRCMCHLARRVVLCISHTLSRGGRPPEQPTTGQRRRRRRVHVARPPRALSRPCKATSGCAVISWCSPPLPRRRRGLPSPEQEALRRVSFRVRDLVLEYKTIQGSRCEAKCFWVIAWFMENPGFPVQDLFSFSFVLADFWVNFGNP